MLRRSECSTCHVRRPPAICDVPPEAQDDFRAVAVLTPYKQRQVVFRQGNPSRGLYLICNGAVKLFHSDGPREHILDFLGPGALFGELSFEGEQPLSSSAQTLLESQLCFLPTELLKPFLVHYPSVAVRVIEALSGQLGQARGKAHELALKGAERRLAALLVRLAHERGEAPGDPPLRYTRRTLAQMIGVSTETAIRLLTKLKEEGLIAVAKRDIIVTDLDGLTSRAWDDGEEA